MYELKDFINAIEDLEIHLVLSATTKYKDLLDIHEKFSLVPIHNFIFSKIDETTNFGSIFSLKAEKNIQISYITTGQNVPDDIEIPEPKKLAKLVLGV
jgi:flagellar biosynthesis protein FlhF